MSLPPKGSKTLTSYKKHLLKAWESTGRKPKELQDQPALPPPLRHLWKWFVEIHTSEVLTFTEIKSWSELTQIKLTPLEVGVLRKLDSIYWEVVNGRSLTSSNQGKQ